MPATSLPSASTSETKHGYSRPLLRRVTLNAAVRLRPQVYLAQHPQTLGVGAHDVQGRVEGG